METSAWRIYVGTRTIHAHQHRQAVRQAWHAVPEDGRTWRPDSGDGGGYFTASVGIRKEPVVLRSSFGNKATLLSGLSPLLSAPPIEQWPSYSLLWVLLGQNAAATQAGIENASDAAIQTAVDSAVNQLML